MFSDIIFDAMQRLYNTYPSIFTTDKTKELLQLIEIMYNQMLYLIQLSDAQTPEGTLAIPEEKLLEVRKVQTDKYMKNDLKPALSPSCTEYVQNLQEQVLEEIIDAIDPEYSFDEVYPKDQVILLLKSIQDVIQFFIYQVNKTILKPISNTNEWATTIYNTKMNIN